MAQEKKKTVFQRIRRIILGSTKPNFITMASVLGGFLVWIYFVSWHALSLMALTTMDNLKMGDHLVGSFNRVGSNLYGYANTVDLLAIHSTVQLLIYLLILIGLILIYRQKKLGFIIYILGNVSTVLTTIFMLGLKFFQSETGYFNIFLLGGATAYFAIGALWIYKWKHKKEVENTIKTKIMAEEAN